MYQKGNNHFRILALFLADYTKQLYLREISRLSNIPLKTAQNIIYSLENEKILKSSISGKNKYFKLNFGNIGTKLLLVQSEIYRTSLFIEKYPQFKIFLNEAESDALLIAFGSFAKFQADKDSDLDLLIVSAEKQKLPFYLLPYKIHEIGLSFKEFIRAVNKQEALIKEIEKNHIILNNHSFYVNTLWSHYGKQKR